MWLVVIGVTMLVMNFAGIGPVGEWTWSERWWALLLPFGLAVLWWSWSDWTGRTKRLAMAKDDERRAERRQKSIDALGLKQPGKSRRK